MKLNELKKTNLYENAMDDRIRDRAKTDFVNNVVSFLSNSLDQAIRSGQVSVNSANGASGQADNAPPETPTTPTTPTTPAQAAEKTRKEKQTQAAAAAQANMAGNPAPVAKPGAPATPTAPTDPFAAKRAQAAAAAQANMAGNPAPVAKPKPTANPKKYDIKGLPIRNMEEGKEFNRLNRIFESILNINEAQMSISDYLGQLLPSPEAFDSKNVMNTRYGPMFKKLLADVEATYSQDKGMAALKKLAQDGFEILTGNADSLSGNEPTSTLRGNATTSSVAGGNAASNAASNAVSNVAGGNAAGDNTAQAQQIQQSTVKVGEINKVIPKLDAKSLNSVKKAITREMTKRGITPGSAVASKSKVDNRTPLPKGKTMKISPARAGGR